MYPLNILDHTAEREDKWKLDRMKTWKTEADKERMKGSGGSDEEGGGWRGRWEAGAHTGMTGDPPFLCEEEQTG